LQAFQFGEIFQTFNLGDLVPGKHQPVQLEELLEVLDFGDEVVGKAQVLEVF
jgi:hypothetical protein